MSTPEMSTLFQNLSLAELTEKHTNLSQNNGGGDTGDYFNDEEEESSAELATEFSCQKFPQFLQRGKIFDINLENPVDGWNIPLPSFMQSSSNSIINEKGEQIFIRAPNFRTGYRPAESQVERDLTEEEIQEEVKSMYQEKVVRFDEEIKEIENVEVLEFKAEQSKEEVSKRRHKGKRKINGNKAKEITEEKVELPYSTKVIRGMKRSKPKPPIVKNSQYIQPPLVAIEELKSIWRQIQQQQQKNQNDACYIEDLGRVSPAENPSFQSDLENLLNLAEIDSLDFQNIVDDLNISECDVGAGIDDLLNEIIPENQDPLSHWAQSGAVEYVEKYHQEKFKRQACEEEIAKLQNEILQIKQDSAVLIGNCKRKEVALLKIVKSWKELSENWKKFEKNTKIEMEKMQKEQDKLIKELNDNKEKLYALGFKN